MIKTEIMKKLKLRKPAAVWIRLWVDGNIWVGRFLLLRKKYDRTMWCWPCCWIRNPTRKRHRKTTQENPTRKSNKQALRREQILEFCIEPKSLSDIMQHLGLKARKNMMNVYINPMISAGVLEMTEPDNPTSRNQMYVAVREDIFLKATNAWKKAIAASSRVYMKEWQCQRLKDLWRQMWKRWCAEQVVEEVNINSNESENLWYFFMRKILFLLVILNQACGILWVNTNYQTLWHEYTLCLRIERTASFRVVCFWFVADVASVRI